ncbi:Hypothetical protein APM_1939 [Acidiphilium sp. PM]|nr:Hypothetical protein APM_1939 [Acidiphilium sp. PM]
MVVMMVVMMMLIGLLDPGATLLRALAGERRIVLAKHDGGIGDRAEKFSIGRRFKAGRRGKRRGGTHHRGGDSGPDHCAENTDCGLFHLRSPFDWRDTGKRLTVAFL